MKYLLFPILLFGFDIYLLGQKPVLDTASIPNWPQVGCEIISNDGDYIAYSVNVAGNRPLLYVKSTSDSFKLEIPAGLGAAFTSDSRRMICLKIGDTLCIVDLVSKNVSFEPRVESFHLPRKGNGRWISYKLSNSDLIIEDLFSGIKKNYGLVSEYLFNDDGKRLVLQQQLYGHDQVRILKWLDLENGKVKNIYQGLGLSDVTFSGEGDELAFCATRDDNKRTSDLLCLYTAKDDSARIIAGGQISDLDPVYTVDAGRLEFSPRGDKVFFHLKRATPAKVARAKAAGVDIWNYKDRYLQSELLQRPDLDHLESFQAVYSIPNRRVLCLEHKNDGFGVTGRLNQGGNADYLLDATKYNWEEARFDTSDRSDLSLINTEDGTRTCLVRRMFDPTFANFSPGGRYVFWFDYSTGCYFAYDIRKRRRRNICRSIPTSIIDNFHDQADPSGPYGSDMWLVNDTAVLIYDRYDIWQVDPSGVKSPINLTEGFGRRNRFVLRCCYEQIGDDQLVLPEDDQGYILLCALDEENKMNGFFRVNLRGRGRLERLSMANELYYFSGHSSFVTFPNTLRKAKDANKYLLKAMSVTEYPNLVTTNDFRSFSPVTDLQPQRGFNWMTGELFHWKTFSGRAGQGILYKPEDFDPKKKYPIIFNYYERMSDGLNTYLYPDFCHGRLNIPWFVSRGYLVFCPDIRYVPGDPGSGIYDYVVSAARAMALKAWVDPHRMGIQGHSFGGFETNYLITRTNMFVAAASSAGVSDMISESGDAGFGGCTGQFFVEYVQFRMAVPFWQNLNAYIRNSPVFQVKKIRTPLLILQNKLDFGVPWGQGVELFTALRRLHKPVWMLQYDGQDHNLDGVSSVDYTIRLTQYFDHFLKAFREPKWMSDGVPARSNGTEDGLELR